MADLKKAEKQPTQYFHLCTIDWKKDQHILLNEVVRIFINGQEKQKYSFFVCVYPCAIPLMRGHIFSNSFFLISLWFRRSHCENFEVYNFRYFTDISRFIVFGVDSQYPLSIEGKNSSSTMSSFFKLQKANTSHLY